MSVNGVVDGAFRRHYGHVFRYLNRRLRDPARAEELAQEVFAAAAESLPDEAEGGPPALAWLYTVASRRFADEARRRGRERRVVSLLRAGRPIEYGPRLTSDIREAVERLPTGQRAVVVLKLLRGLTFAQIGTELGLSEAAAKMRFVRALRELRADLTERGIEP
jgi:RNA polymerase sigma-70 factor (ECF subfamily)